MSFPEDVLLVKEGDLDHGMWGLAEHLMAKEDQVIMLDLLQSCSLVSDRHEAYQTGMGRVAGGIIGAALLGPIGAAGGLLAGGKRRIDETIVLCRLFDGRTFTAECSPLTAAKLNQISNINQLNQTSIARNQNIQNSRFVSDSVDTVECPMCAENIKRKAKICRFCGYKIAEERESKIQKVTADSDTEQILSYSDLYQVYLNNVGYEDVFTEFEGILILKTFIEVHKKNPKSTYREVVELVKEKLELTYKTHLLDFFREGFKFARSDKKFMLMEDDGMIVVYKSNWQ